jgi:hypothetical protein
MREPCLDTGDGAGRLAPQPEPIGNPPFGVTTGSYFPVGCNSEGGCAASPVTAQPRRITGSAEARCLRCDIWENLINKIKNIM